MTFDHLSECPRCQASLAVLRPLTSRRFGEPPTLLLEDREARHRLRLRMRRARLERRRHRPNPLAGGADPRPPEWYRPQPPAPARGSAGPPGRRNDEERVSVSPTKTRPEESAADLAEPGGTRQEGDDLPLSPELPFGDWRAELRARLQRIRARQQRPGEAAGAAAAGDEDPEGPPAGDQEPEGGTAGDEAREGEAAGAEAEGPAQEVVPEAEGARLRDEEEWEGEDWGEEEPQWEEEEWEDEDWGEEGEDWEGGEAREPEIDFPEADDRLGPRWDLPAAAAPTAYATPEPAPLIPEGPPPGPLGHRAAAALCDGLLLAALGALLATVAARTAGVPVGALLRSSSLWPLAATWSIFAIGYGVLLVGTCGQTAGKMLLRLRVVGSQRPAVGFPRALARTAGFALTALPLGLGLLPALRDRWGRAVHDRLSGTRVVRR